MDIGSSGKPVPLAAGRAGAHLLHRIRVALGLREAPLVTALRAEIDQLQCRLADRDAMAARLADTLRGTIGQLEGRLAAATQAAALLSDAAAQVLEDTRHGATPPSPQLGVSVILPVRDRPGLLLDAIRSVLAQSWRNLELIIVDDGSALDVAGLVARHVADPRIRVLRQSALGVSAARNRALRQARHALVAYIDSDNVWLPGFLEAMAGGFARQPAMQSAYGILLTAAHGRANKVLWDAFDRQRLLRENFIDMNVFVHRRSLFERLGGFDEALDRLVDWDLILRYTAASPAIRLPAWGAVYRVLGDRRISDTVPLAPSLARIRAKFAPVRAAEVAQAAG